MPTSIIIAIISVTFVAGSRVLGLIGILAFGGESIGMGVLSVVIAVLVLAGIVAGQRLAWQWGRILGILGAVVLTISGFSMFYSESDVSYKVGAILLLFEAAALYVTFFMLGTAGAKEYFGLICPNCGASKVKGGNFLFTKAVCRNCKTDW